LTTRLVWENLKHKPMRSLLSVLLIGVPVTLVLSLVGLSHGLSEDAQTRARGVGADIIMRGASTSKAAISFSGTTINEKYIGLIEQYPHVKMALGVVVHPVELPLNVMGVDLGEFNRMSGGFTYLAGGSLRGPDDVLIDKYYAAQRHAQVGSTLTIMGRPWRVSGIIQGGKLARIVVDKKRLQFLDSAGGKVTVIYVKLDKPALADHIVEQLRQDENWTDFSIDTMEAFTSMFSVNNIEQVRIFTYVVIGIGVLIGFAVVCLSMYMAVLQRTREIGILKSLGGSNSFILRIVVIEALTLGLFGTVLGILMSYGACWVIGALVPASIPMIIVYSWWPIALVITLAGTGLGSLYPGLSAARHDPIEALAYE
jgi:putative ABC transport system permease protein